MTVFFVVCVAVFTCSGVSLGAPVTQTSYFASDVKSTTFVPPRPDRRPCPRNVYCNGFHLPLVRASELKGRQLSCSTVKDIDDNCCLGSPFHYVCYDLKVDGVRLSINKTSMSGSTDFQQLCEDLLSLYNKTLGSYTMVTLGEGSGSLIYGGRASGDNSGRWEEQEGTHYIENLACEFSHTDDDPAEIDAYITPKPRTTKTSNSENEAKYKNTGNPEHNTEVTVKKGADNKQGGSS